MLQKKDIYFFVDEVFDEDFEVYHVAAFRDRLQNEMIDEHICELFPELENLGIYDLSEGELEYSGGNPHHLKEELFEMGFNVI